MTYKYILDARLFGLSTFPKKGEIKLKEETSQKDLEYLYNIEFKGVTRIEIAEDKKPTKKRAKK